MSDVINLTPLQELKMLCSYSLVEPVPYDFISCKTLKTNYIYVTSETCNIDNQLIHEALETCIDKALDYDFMNTIVLASLLRKHDFIEVAHVIMIRAVLHPKRVEFNKIRGPLLTCYLAYITRTAKEIFFQVKYFLHVNKGIKHTPSILKRVWAKEISALTWNELSECFLQPSLPVIDAIRICHAHSPAIDQLMRYGGIFPVIPILNYRQFLATCENYSGSALWAHILYNMFTMPCSSSPTAAYTHIGFEFNGKHHVISDYDGLIHHMDFIEYFLSDKKDDEWLSFALTAIKAGVKHFDTSVFEYFRIILSYTLHRQYYWNDLNDQIIQAFSDCINEKLDKEGKVLTSTLCLADDSTDDEYVSSFNIFAAARYACISAADDVYVYNQTSYTTTSMNAKYDVITRLSEALTNSEDDPEVNFAARILKDKIDNNISYDNILMFVSGRPGFDIEQLLNIYRTQVNSKVNVIIIDTSEVALQEYEKAEISLDYRTCYAPVFANFGNSKEDFICNLINFWNSFDK